MKPLYLSVEGLFNKIKETYDFTAQTANLVVLYNQDITTLKSMLSLGFFGGEKTGKIDFTYEYNGEQYQIKRNFEEGTAEFSFKDGNITYSGEEEVNKNIMAHLKMTKEVFEKLVVINRENIFEGFMLSEKQREEYVNDITNGLLCDKDEIESIEKKIKEKFDKVSTQIEIIEEVDPNELENLKNEIKEKSVIRQDLKSEIEILNRSIAKGEEVGQAIENIAQEKLELSNTLAMQGVINELESLIEKSTQVEIVAALIERKEQIQERNKEDKEKVVMLQEEIDAASREIEKGEKTSKEIEKILIHCIERLVELRKTLYKRIEALGGDEAFQKTIRSKVDSYYEKDEADLDVLNGRNKEIEEELEAVNKSCDDLKKRKAEITRKSDLKKAIRDGAILEAEMNKLKDNIVTSKAGVEYYKNKLSTIIPEIEQRENRAIEQKNSLIEINRFITGRFSSKEEAMNNAVQAQQELYKNHILITFHEGEMDAIESKIKENVVALKSYKEDIIALEGAKTGLDGYIEKINEKKALLEQKLTQIRVEKGENDKIIALEYGQKCPICSNIVLNKKNKQNDAKVLLDLEMRALDELKKVAIIIEEYYAKYEQINRRLGELGARIKISEAYIKSLEETMNNKKQDIAKALQQSGAQNSYDLAERLRLSIEKHSDTQKAFDKHNELASSLDLNEESLAMLIEEKRYLEEEQIPLTIFAYNKADEELKKLQRKYKSLEDILGGVNASDRLEELTLIEKESDTLEQELTEKRAKIDDLVNERNNLQQLIYIISSRRRNVKIGDVEYDNQDIIIKTIATSIGEIVEEIKESEKEAEEIKIEYSAVRKVIARMEKDIIIKKYEYENIKAKIASDENMLENFLSEFDEKLSILNIKNTKELKKAMLTEERKQDIREEIAAHNKALAIRTNNIERLQNIIDASVLDHKHLDENKASSLLLQEKYEDLGQKIASIVAKRAEMKSRAKQKIFFKEKQTKYTEKMQLLTEITNLLDKEGKLDEFIIKLSSKRLYALTKGKYNLDIIEGSMELLNNSKGGKVVEKSKYSVEEKLLISLVIGTSLHRTLIDMVGGETLMIIFPLKEKETSSEIVTELATYAKKKSLMVVTENECVLEKLKKL